MNRNREIQDSTYITHELCCLKETYVYLSIKVFVERSNDNFKEYLMWSFQCKFLKSVSPIIFLCKIFGRGGSGILLTSANFDYIAM